jgi:hypothetical protein
MTPFEEAFKDTLKASYKHDVHLHHGTKSMSYSSKYELLAHFWAVAEISSYELEL